MARDTEFVQFFNFYNRLCFTEVTALCPIPHTWHLFHGVGIISPWTWKDLSFPGQIEYARSDTILLLKLGHKISTLYFFSWDVHLESFSHAMRKFRFTHGESKTPERHASIFHLTVQLRSQPVAMTQVLNSCPSVMKSSQASEASFGPSLDIVESRNKWSLLCSALITDPQNPGV